MKDGTPAGALTDRIAVGVDEPIPMYPVSLTVRILFVPEYEMMLSGSCPEPGCIANAYPDDVMLIPAYDPESRSTPVPSEFDPVHLVTYDVRPLPVKLFDAFSVFPDHDSPVPAVITVEGVL